MSVSVRIISTRCVDGTGTIQTTSEAPCVTSVALGDMTPHTLIGRAQSSDHPHGKGQRSGGSSKRPKREAWGPRGDTQSRPPEALDRCAGVTGAVGTARNTRHPPYYCIQEYSREGVKGDFSRILYLL